jgi:hypothetical protein
MPDLSLIADPEALDNRYTGKIVVYVEGDEDEAILSRIMGPDVADRIEFKLPLLKGNGHGVVIRRVLDERPSNARVFGLVDGEAAAAFGYLDHLLNCNEPIFVVPEPTLAGIIFLGEHEIENLLLRHCNLIDYLSSHASINGLKHISQDAIATDLTSISRRFMLAAYLKYASACLSASDPSVSPLNVDGFRGDGKVLHLVGDARRKFGARDRDLIRRLLAIAKQIRAKVRPGITLIEERVRLADGKGLKIRTFSTFQMRPEHEGHLLERVRTSAFAGTFRTALLTEVKGT